MNVNIVESKSLFFAFEDHRNEKGKGILIEQASKEIYSHAGSDTNNAIRQKFGLLALTQLPAGVFFRIPFCLYDMFSGGFVTRAISDAKHEFKCRQIEKGEKISQVVLNRLIFKNVMINLITTIARIALYPIALVGLQLVAIFGLFSPLDGMVLYGRLEKLIGLNDGLDSEFPMLRFSAPCMQAQQIWKQRQWYKSFTHFNSSTRRSLHLILMNQLTHFAPYFDGRIERLSEMLSAIEKNIKRLCIPNLLEEEEDISNVNVLSDVMEARLLKASLESTIKSINDKITEEQQKVDAQEVNLGAGNSPAEARLSILKNQLRGLSNVALTRKQLKESLALVQAIVVEKDLWIDGGMCQPDPSIPNIKKLEQLLSLMTKGDSNDDLRAA